VRTVLLSLQVLVLMCTPLPQAAYAAVGVGRSAGLGLGLLFALYLISDVVMFSATRLLAHRAGLPGVVRLKAWLPAWLGRALDGGARRARMAPDGWTGLAAVFAAGYANLYLAALITGLGGRRTLAFTLAGIAGDMVQFSGAIVLAGVLARAISIPGGGWFALMTAPLVVASLPGWPRAYRTTIDYLRRPRPAFLLVPSALPSPVLVPVRTDDHSSVHHHG
jgi:hypothetical protein